MSYARWGNNSSVYVYAHCGGGIECCGCWLETKPYTSLRFYTSGEMIEHLNKHKSVGHKVPDYCYEGILEDYPNKTAFIDGEE